MENCSCSGVVGCLIGISGVLAAAMFAAVVALAMEASSLVCPQRRRWRLQRRWWWKRHLQPATAPVSAVDRRRKRLLWCCQRWRWGQYLLVCVLWCCCRIEFLWLKFSAGVEKLEFLIHEEKPHAEFYEQMANLPNAGICDVLVDLMF